MISLTPDQQKKGALMGGFALLAIGILYFQLRDDSPPPPLAAPTAVTAPVKVSASAAKTGTAVPVPPGGAVGSEAKKLGTTSAQLDPTLRMEAMLVTESLVY